MAREQMGTNIEPGIVQRVVQGLRYVITGVGPDSFMGPNQPLAPIAQDQVEGRAFDYPVAYNQRFTPRSGEQVSFEQLRVLADGYDLMRLVIETRKDQVKAYEWEIVPKDEDNEDPMEDAVAEVRAFLESPDKEHSWDDWLSMVIEDLLVIDAVCVYPRMNKGGKLYGLELVDGATIKRVIDDTGRTPLPPSPAYQQIIKGLPAADYTRDTLVYMMRNPRTNRLYGYSPVEQVMMTVNIALRRQLTQLDFYTQGTVPEAIAQVPENWTPKQISDFQLWWDSVNEGSSAQQKRKMRFIPSLKDIVFPRQEVLKDEFDEWLARIVCFAFSIPPTAFIKQLNRATADQAADSAKEEGLKPLLRWVEQKLSYLIQKHMGYADLAFRFRLENEVDAKSQADIDSIYISAKVKTPDEVRESLGLPPMTPEEREAAFPEPPAIGPDGQPMMDANGKKIPGSAKVMGIRAPEEIKAEAEAKAKAKADAEWQQNAQKVLDTLANQITEMRKSLQQPHGPTPMEKILGDTMAMLDPQRVIKAQPPTVVEVRPEVNVDVGETNVHNFPPKQEREARREARDPRKMGKMLVGERLADGRMVARWVDDPDVAGDVITKVDEEKSA